MDALFPKKADARPQPFTGFGDSDYWLQSPGELSLDLNQTRRQLRRQIRELCPDGPGVYGMVDRQGQLIYVGMSQRLRLRLRTYFHARSLRGKESRIAGYARTLVWQPTGHGLAAQLREIELIRRFGPRFNVIGKGEPARVGYVFVTREEAPRFRAGGLPPRGRETWGPVPAGRRTRAAVERLNLFFKLRDCPRDVPMQYSDQRQLFDEPRAPACLRVELSTCLGPCAALCSRRAYAAQLTQARDFLDGRTTRAVIEPLESAMLRAAETRRFEQAALLRDAWEDLTYLSRQLDQIREVRERYWFVYPVSGHGGSAHWLAIADGRVAAVLPAPADSAAAVASLAQLEEIYERTHRLPSDSPRAAEEARIVASWFRQFPEELGKTLPPPEAIARCREGTQCYAK